VDARERYRARLIEATLRAGEHALRLGDARAAQEHADRATALDPFAERAWHLRMSAHRAVGERAAALRAYDECRRLLADNLGVEPAPAIRQLFLDLLREDGQSTTVDAAMAAVLAAAHELGARPELAAGGRVIALLTRAVELAAPVPSGAALDRVS
jgi:DNA-binding SARP family transcriptional activator